MELLKKLPSPVGMSHDEIMELLYREEYGYPRRSPQISPLRGDP